jgi:lipopolysaccharide/colanic/teichoic acid biosynthesis glycosyltransferase
MRVMIEQTAPATATLPQISLSIERAPEPHFAYDFTKRAIDIVFAAAMLVLLLPVFAAIALLIVVTSGRPVFFSQKRLGLGGEAFDCLKFRTMVPDAEARRDQVLSLNTTGGPAFKHPDDPRLTAIGRFLRKTSLDELPQFLNILMGNMSLAGPRPLPVYENQYVGNQSRRLSVKPGLTCSWQISGRSGITFDRWMEMDIEYVETRSVLLDLNILMRTPLAVITARGAM